MVLEVLVLELPLQVCLVTLDLLHMFFVKLDPLYLKVFQPYLSLPLCFRQSIALVAGHQELDLEGLLGLALAGPKHFLVADLTLTELKRRLVQVTLPVLDTLPGL